MFDDFTNECLSKRRDHTRWMYEYEAIMYMSMRKFFHEKKQKPKEDL